MTELRKRGPSAKPVNVKHQTKSVKQVNTRNESSLSFSSIAGYFLKIVFFIIVVPPMLNYAALQKERTFLSSNLTRYDIGFNQKLFFQCSGTGKPTVILDAPTGMTSDSWLFGQKELSKLTRVCIYDRAGLGFSDSPPKLNISDPGEGAVARTLGKEATAVRMVNDLHRLVTFSYPQERPFVLVGSELGGLIARMYAHLHPQDVDHIVMINPISETLFDDVSNKNDLERSENPWISYWFGHLLPTFRLLQVSAMVGLSRLGLLVGLMTSPLTLSDDGENSMSSIRQKHHLCDAFHFQAVFDEHKGINESLAQMKEIRAAWPLPPKIQSTIISGSFYDEQLPSSLNRGWSRAVQDVIDHMGSKHHVIAGADRQMIHSPSLVKEVFAPLVRIIKSFRVHPKS